jgi:competence protein ComEA
MSTPPRQDWTTGPARFIAAGALGGAAIVGLAWAIASSRTTAPSAQRPAARFLHAPTQVHEPRARYAPDDATTEAGTPPDDVLLQEPLPPPPEPAPPTRALIVNINRADAAELELLPGIGPALAQRIVEHRARHGRFRRIDDLVAVKGIGPRTLERIRPFVRVD